MSDTTSLADLPSDPAIGSGSGGQNVVLQTTDKQSTYDPNDGISAAGGPGVGVPGAGVPGAGVPGPNIDSNEINEQKMMNELVSGIQQASANGGTSLPSRDIPTNTVHFADDQVKPNYVPQPQQEQSDYIHNTDTEQDILARRVKNQNSRDSLEILYDEFQIPIIIGLLYFIFQLPIVKSKVLAILPSLFNKDGNPNLTGYIINSLFFGIAYYIISKTLVHLQNV
jgi:hypothetical protein